MTTTPERLEKLAGRLLVLSAKARVERNGPDDMHELRHLLAAVHAGNSDKCEHGANCTLDIERIALYRVAEAELAARFGHGDRYPLHGEVEVDGVIYESTP